MLIGTINGKVIDKQVNDSKGNTYHNLFVLQKGSRSAQRVTCSEIVYNKYVPDSPRDKFSEECRIYANVSDSGQAYHSLVIQ